MTTASSIAEVENVSESSRHMLVRSNHPNDDVIIMADETSLPPSSSSSYRHLQSSYSSSSRTVLVLRVIVSNIGSPTVSNDELYLRVFSDGSSLKHQMARCSAGALQLNPTNYGVMDVYVPADWGTGRQDIVALAEAATLATIGGGYTNVRQIADHIMFVLPNMNDGFVGSAEMCPNHSAGTSTYGDVNAASLTVLMHEIGHNLGLKHAASGGDEYGDYTSNMGISSSELGGPLYCYNAGNHWALGWFSDSRLDLSTIPSSPITVTMPAFVDYQETAGALDQYVLVKVGNFYLQYSCAKDYNAGASTLPNQLVIVYDADPGMGGQTNLITGLDMQNPYYSDGSVAIQVCSVQTSGTVDYMIISIGQGGTNCAAGGYTAANSVPQQVTATPATTSSSTTTTTTTTTASNQSGWKSWTTTSHAQLGESTTTTSSTKNHGSTSSSRTGWNTWG
jgi:Gametolysin peptidase M11